MKKFIVMAALSIAAVTAVSAKSYHINLVNPTKVGTIQLKPGQYDVKVAGSNAVFTDLNTSKSFQTPVKVENTEKKFDDTRVQSSKDGDTDKIDEIDLGGSKTKLGF
jgi:hypothetical protein